MRSIALNAAHTLCFKMVLAADGHTPVTGATVAITISKNGGSFANPDAGATNATEVANGIYKVTLGSADADTAGDLVVRGTAATCDDLLEICRVGMVIDFVTTVTGNVSGNVVGNVGGNVDGSVGSVAGSVGGNVDGSVGSVTGDLGGDVLGAIQGNISGDIQGDLLGDVTGTISGTISGNVTGIVNKVAFANIMFPESNFSISTQDTTSSFIVEDLIGFTDDIFNGNIAVVGLPTGDPPTPAARRITSFNGTTGRFSFAIPFPALPTNGSSFKMAFFPPPEVAIRKTTALANFEFLMTDSTLHSPATGKTVTATRSIDGAAFGACANAVAEVANGIYKISLATTDLAGSVVTFQFTAALCDTTFVTIVLQP